MSSKAKPNVSCSTKATRSAGDSVSRTTWSAPPTDSASSAWSSGVAVSAGGCRPAAVPSSVDRVGWFRRARSMLRQIRDTTVVNQPVGLPMVPSSTAGSAEPGVLDGVVGVRGVAEDPEGDGPKVGPVDLELLGQGGRLVHVSHSPGVRCHTH